MASFDTDVTRRELIEASAILAVLGGLPGAPQTPDLHAGHAREQVFGGLDLALVVVDLYDRAE